MRLMLTCIQPCFSNGNVHVIHVYRQKGHDWCIEKLVIAKGNKSGRDKDGECETRLPGALFICLGVSDLSLASISPP